MSRKSCFVFCHGFGFDATFWDRLRPYFIDVNTVYLDLGYFGDKSTTLTYDESVDYIGIGHSLGLMKLLSLNIDFKCLIGLQGFVNFTGFDEQLQRVRKRELMSLTRHFLRSPEITLNQLYQRTGVPWALSQKPPLHLPLLTKDLALLALSMPITAPMLILGANDDKIVPPELIEDNFAHHPQVQIEIINQVQHGLGYFKPGVVFDNVMRFSGY